jgi:hypothetical protein
MPVINLRRNIAVTYREELGLSLGKICARKCIGVMKEFKFRSIFGSIYFACFVSFYFIPRPFFSMLSKYVLY